MDLNIQTEKWGLYTRPVQELDPDVQGSLYVRGSVIAGFSVVYITVSDCVNKFVFLQLELEFDLILQKKDAVSKAITDWRVKWVPAICSFAQSQTSKAVKAILANEKDGMSIDF